MLAKQFLQAGEFSLKVPVGCQNIKAQIQSLREAHSEGSAVGRTRRTPKTWSPTLSPVHTANSNSIEYRPEAIKGHCHDFPQVVGGPSPPKKCNRNAEQRQRRR